MKNNDTEKKILNAVGEILKKEGFKSLKVTKIAQTAGVDKKLIYVHFGSMENLIETYIYSHDYWTNIVRKVNDAIHNETSSISLENLFNFYLEKQYKMLTDDVVQQQIILWGISEKNEVIDKIFSEREKVVGSLFELINHQFPSSLVDYKAVYAIIVSGLYHLTLHSKFSNTHFCGVDLESEIGKNSIISAIKLINSLMFNL